MVNRPEIVDQLDAAGAKGTFFVSESDFAVLVLCDIHFLQMGRTVGFNLFNKCTSLS